MVQVSENPEKGRKDQYPIRPIIVRIREMMKIAVIKRA
jgi:hypothetical protein